MLDILLSKPQWRTPVLTFAAFLVFSMIARLIVAGGMMNLSLSLISIIAILTVVYEEHIVKESETVMEPVFDLATAKDGDTIAYFAEANTYTWDRTGSGDIKLTASNFARLLVKTHKEQEETRAMFQNDRIQKGYAKSELKYEQERNEQRIVQANSECEDRCRKMMKQAEKDSIWADRGRAQVRIMMSDARLDRQDIMDQVKEYEVSLAALKEEIKVAEEKIKTMNVTLEKEPVAVAIIEEVSKPKVQMSSVGTQTSTEATQNQAEDVAVDATVLDIASIPARRGAARHTKTQDHRAPHMKLSQKVHCDRLRRPARETVLSIRRSQKARQALFYWQKMNSALGFIQRDLSVAQSPALSPEVLLGPKPAAGFVIARPIDRTAWRGCQHSSSSQQSLAQRFRQEGTRQIKAVKQPYRAAFPVAPFFTALARPDVDMQAIDTAPELMPLVQLPAQIVQVMALPEVEDAQMAAPAPPILELDQEDEHMAVFTIPPIQATVLGAGIAQAPTFVQQTTATQAANNALPCEEIEMGAVQSDASMVMTPSFGFLPEAFVPLAEQEMRVVDEATNPQANVTLQQEPAPQEQQPASFSGAQKGKWRQTVEHNDDVAEADSSIWMAPDNAATNAASNVTGASSESILDGQLEFSGSSQSLPIAIPPPAFSFGLRPDVIATPNKSASNIAPPSFTFGAAVPGPSSAPAGPLLPTTLAQQPDTKVSFTFGLGPANNSDVAASIPTFKVGLTPSEQKRAAHRAAEEAAAAQTFKSAADLAWEAEILAEEEEQAQEQLRWAAAQAASMSAGAVSNTMPGSNQSSAAAFPRPVAIAQAQQYFSEPIPVGRGNKAARRM